MGAALSGGTAPYLYAWLDSMDVGWIFSAYIVVLAVVTLVAVRFIPETAGLEMDRIPLPGEEKVSSEDESTAVPAGR